MENGSTVVNTQQSYQIQPYANRESYELAKSMAGSLASSTLVPPEFQGQKGLGNCLIAMEMAGRVGISPFMCIQNLYVIYGRPSWSASFLIALVNSSGLFDGKLKFHLSEDKQSCEAYAVDKDTGETLIGPVVSIEMARKAGWHDRKGSQWQIMPEQMLRYRAAAFFVRTYCPELALGMHTREEIYDAGDEYGYSQDATTKPIRETREERAEKSKNLTSELLGDSAPVVDAELKSEPPANPMDALATQAETKAVYNKILKFCNGDKDAAQSEIDFVTDGRPSKAWTKRTILALEGRLEQLKRKQADIERAEKEATREKRVQAKMKAEVNAEIKTEEDLGEGGWSDGTDAVRPPRHSDPDISAAMEEQAAFI